MASFPLDLRIVASSHLLHYPLLQHSLPLLTFFRIFRHFFAFLASCIFGKLHFYICRSWQSITCRMRPLSYKQTLPKNKTTCWTTGAGEKQRDPERFALNLRNSYTPLFPICVRNDCIRVFWYAQFRLHRRWAGWHVRRWLRLRNIWVAVCMDFNMVCPFNKLMSNTW